MSIPRGVDLAKVIDAAEVIATALDRPLTSKQWMRAKRAAAKPTSSRPN